MKRCSEAPSGQRAERAPSRARRGQRGFRGLSEGERLGLRGGEGQIPHSLCVQRGPNLLCGVSGVLARVGGGARPGKGVPGAVLEGLRHFLYAVPSHAPAGRRLSPGKREKSMSSHLSPHCLCGHLLPHPCGGDAGRGSRPPRAPRVLGHGCCPALGTPPGSARSFPPGESCPLSVPWREGGASHEAQSPPPFTRQESHIHFSTNPGSTGARSAVTGWPWPPPGLRGGCRVALQLCASFLRTGASGVSSDLLEMHDFTLGPKLPWGRL